MIISFLFKNKLKKKDKNKFNQITHFPYPVSDSLDIESQPGSKYKKTKKDLAKIH